MGILVYWQLEFELLQINMAWFVRETVLMNKEIRVFQVLYINLTRFVLKKIELRLFNGSLKLGLLMSLTFNNIPLLYFCDRISNESPLTLCMELDKKPVTRHDTSTPCNLFP